MRDVFEQTPVMIKSRPTVLAAPPGKLSGVSFSVHQKWCYRRHHAGAGPRARETMAVTFIIGNTYQLDSASLICRATVSPLHWRTNLRKRNRSARCRTDGTGPDPVCDYLHVLAASKFMIMRLAKYEGARYGYG